MRDSTDVKPRRLTVQQAAARVHRSPDTIRQRIHCGSLPAERVDRRGTWGILEADLELSGLAWPAPVRPSPAVEPAGLDGLADVASRIISTWPRLSEERRGELGRLLAAP